MSKISFILHGKHRGNTKLLSDIREAFNSSYEVVFYYTEFSGHAIGLARQAALLNSAYVISAGGDGTMNEVANGIMLSGNKDVKVGLLPNGTGNDFAKTIGVSNNIAELKMLIESDSVKEIDLGLANFKNLEGKDESRYFINITDVGLGGFIAQKLACSSKLLGAFLTFQKAIVTTFLSYKHKQAKTKADDFSYEGKILSYIIANGKYFGAGLGIAPDAKPDDGQFEIVLGAEISLWDYLMNLGKVRKCLKIDHPQMSYHTAKEILIETDEPLPIDMDGEFIGYSPMKVTVVPKALKFLCPLQNKKALHISAKSF